MAGHNQIPLRWSATPLFAPITSYDIGYIRTRWDEVHDIAEAEQPISWRTGLTALGGTFRASPGYTYCFEVVAHDADGVRSKWEWPRCTAVPLDDRSLTRSGGWTPLTGSRFYLSTALRSTARGATLRIAGMGGPRIALLATTCPECGTVNVYLNGHLIKKVALGATTTFDRKVVEVWETDCEVGECGGSLTIKVVSSGKPVIIDGVVNNSEHVW